MFFGVLQHSTIITSPTKNWTMHIVFLIKKLLESLFLSPFISFVEAFYFSISLMIYIVITKFVNIKVLFK
jgi:hypothetical protein